MRVSVGGNVPKVKVFNRGAVCIYIGTKDTEPCEVDRFQAANYVLYAVNGDLNFRAYESNTNASDDVVWTPTLSGETVYHFVLSYDLTTTTASLQINGATAQTKVMVNTPNGATDDFFVGQIGDGNLYFGGWIDQLDIWIGRALSNSQGLDHYNGGVGKAFPFTP